MGVIQSASLAMKVAQAVLSTPIVKTYVDQLSGRTAPSRQDALDLALIAARTIKDEGARAQALAGFAAHLPDELRGETVSEALAGSRAGCTSRALYP